MSPIAATKPPTEEPTDGAPCSSPRATDPDPVLAALLRAPIVPFTDEERAMVAEAMRDPHGWQPADEFMAKVAALPPVG